MPILRRTLVATLCSMIFAATAPLRAAEETVKVWKSPTCGCSSMWVDHLRENGFEVVSEDVPNMTMVKRMADVPDHLQSCHTAKVGDYVIEGRRT